MRSHFRFTKQEKRGIFFLLVLIILLQLGYFRLSEYLGHQRPSNLTIDWHTQQYIDSLKLTQEKSRTASIYPFNPNFMSDYKGYVLGLTPEELDRLYTFREAGKFVNSVEEFQRVTQVSDSLLLKVAPFLKFPEFTRLVVKPKLSTAKKEVGDINLASAKELQQISGIGEVLSKRIVKFRNSLGGFYTDDQLYEVYGLSPEVVRKVLSQYKVLKPTKIKKISLNKASIGELASLGYISYQMAENIVRYRNKVGKFDSIAQLRFIDVIPQEKIERIALYLTL